MKKEKKRWGEGREEEIENCTLSGNVVSPCSCSWLCPVPGAWYLSNELVFCFLKLLLLSYTLQKNTPKYADLTIQFDQFLEMSIHKWPRSKLRHGVAWSSTFPQVPPSPFPANMLPPPWEALAVLTSVITCWFWTSCAWNHCVQAHLCLASFTQGRIWEIHLCCWCASAK